MAEPDDELEGQSPQLTRRDLLRRASVGAFAISMFGGLADKALGFYGPLKYKGRDLKNTLKILQWSHFVPAYDTFFDNTWTKQWGEKNDTEVKVDHINNALLFATGSSEVAAGQGHDLFQFLAPPASFQRTIVPVNDIVQEVTRKLGKMTDVAYRSTYNPRTKKYFGFPDNYVPDPVHYRHDLWFNVGRAPNTWEDVRKAAKELKDAGHPVGIGMSQELDSDMALIALLQCYGAYIQNRDAHVTLNNKGTVEALKVMRDIYKRGMTPEIFSWTAASNNQGFLAGRLSLALNAISIARALDGPPYFPTGNPDLDKVTWIAPIPRGPAQRLGLEHVMGVYVIWKFAQNKAGAKKFLVDQQLNYTQHFLQSGFYNFPAWSNGVKGGFKAIRRYTAKDKFRPHGKYTVLTTIAEKYTTNVGHPGFSNAAVDEIFNKYLIPQMFAAVAQDKMSAQDAAKTFDRQMRSIFTKWRSLKLI
jgi:multiple sugar transport system substrate-binding protein